MKTTKKYTKEDLIKDLQKLKESGKSPIKNPDFFKPWDWTDAEEVYKKGKVVKTV
jgi:hypothetical protein